MIALLLISCVVLGAVLFRSVDSVLHQIPDNNVDFNAFISPADVACRTGAAFAPSRDGALVKRAKPACYRMSLVARICSSPLKYSHLIWRKK